MWSSGDGADAMKRIAAHMDGGLETSFLLELTVYRVVFAISKFRSVPAYSRHGLLGAVWCIIRSMRA
jgi:Cu/Ag efflux pump CusA